MPRFPLAALGFTLTLLVGCMNRDSTTAILDPDVLAGAWEITSVQRDGEPDPLQVGARLTFTGNEVKFQPNAAEPVAYIS